MVLPCPAVCGFVGFLAPSGLGPDDETRVRSMADRLAHRGPDDHGAWLDPTVGVAFAHRRLAIVDLSPTGAQPMTSASGRTVIAFNGEIYNHEALRRRLGSVVYWRGRSDTEVLVEAIERWGLEAALEASVGMFAFAVYDRERRELALARDRMGEKPCHYGWHGGTLLFGSELKALRAHPDYRATTDLEALAAYLRHGYVPAPRTIDAGTAKLAPGAVARWRVDGPVGAAPELGAYWSLRTVAAAGLAAPFAGDDGEAAERLEALLADAVALQRVADVPLGAFLSGGIDSSTVVALMQAAGGTPVRTFAIGFTEAAYDESGHARAVAAHLGTDHTELRVTPTEAQAVLPTLPTLYDEPFGDASAVPTYLVAQLARRDVTVALSGDGGDELFFGYGRYLATARTRGRAERLPASVRAAASAALGLVPTGPVAAVLEGARVGAFPHLFPDRVAALRAALTGSTVLPAYRAHLSRWKRPDRLLAAAVAEPATLLTDDAAALAGGDAYQRMAFVDSGTYLPDDVLVKVDRAAMAVSLETRVPLLDHRIVEFAWSLPTALKVRDGVGKRVLRGVLDRHVPRALIDRPKMGFGVPIDVWLRGPLRAWAEDLLDPAALRAGGVFRPEVVSAKWRAHLSGRADWQHQLWPLLAYLAWARGNGR
jgi:asparagine synthase (glutamine-hydrolysing)